MVSLFVPGRLCLFGEHSDWAGALRTVDPTLAPGACIVTGTDQGITATAEAASDFELVSRLPDGSERSARIAMTAAALGATAAAADFFSYSAGTAGEIQRRSPTGGLRLTITRNDLPVARGLSSSAAICVLVARAWNAVYGLGWDVREEMEVAYAGERAAGSQCGRMDQACAYGKRLVALRFDGDVVEVEPLRSARPLVMMIVDLCRQKDTRRILDDLHRTLLGGVEPARVTLRGALGRENLALVARARDALARGDAESVGALMTEAQERFDRDVAPACPSELAAPHLHALLAHPACRELAWGGKGVGSQGDGAAQLVCRGVDERDALFAELARAGTFSCLPLTIDKED